MRKEPGSQSVNIRVHPWLGSNLDRSLENEFGRASECDVVEISLNFLKTDLKFVTASRQHRDRTAAFLTGGKDERAGDYSRAARERFVFHAAFIGANGDFVGSALFDEVHVCAVR